MPNPEHTDPNFCMGNCLDHTIPIRRNICSALFSGSSRSSSRESAKEFVIFSTMRMPPAPRRLALGIWRPKHQDNQKPANPVLQHRKANCSCVLGPINHGSDVRILQQPKPEQVVRIDPLHMTKFLVLQDLFFLPVGNFIVGTSCTFCYCKGLRTKSTGAERSPNQKSHPRLFYKPAEISNSGKRQNRL